MRLKHGDSNWNELGSVELFVMYAEGTLQSVFMIHYLQVTIMTVLSMQSDPTDNKG